MKQIIKLTIITCAVTLALSGCSESTNSSSYTAPLTSSKAHVKELSTYSAETFFDTTSIMGSSFSPHGDKILVSSDGSGIYSLYEVNVQTGGKTRLTDFTDSTYPIRYFPNDERVLFTKDTGGNLCTRN